MVLGSLFPLSLIFLLLLIELCPYLRADHVLLLHIATSLKLMH